MLWVASHGRKIDFFEARPFECEKECRAVDLLQTIIPSHLFNQYCYTSQIQVSGNITGKIYTIERSKKTKVHDGLGRIRGTYCIHHPYRAGEVPPTDLVLALYLYLTNSETLFLKTANYTPCRKRAVTTWGAGARITFDTSNQYTVDISNVSTRRIDREVRRIVCAANMTNSIPRPQARTNLTVSSIVGNPRFHNHVVSSVNYAVRNELGFYAYGHRRGFDVKPKYDAALIPFQSERCDRFRLNPETVKTTQGKLYCKGLANHLLFLEDVSCSTNVLAAVNDKNPYSVLKLNTNKKPKHIPVAKWPYTKDLDDACLGQLLSSYMCSKYLQKDQNPIQRQETRDTDLHVIRKCIISQKWFDKLKNVLSHHINVIVDDRVDSLIFLLPESRHVGKLVRNPMNGHVGIDVFENSAIQIKRAYLKDGKVKVADLDYESGVEIAYGRFPDDSDLSLRYDMAMYQLNYLP